nr:D-2-hydroxyacid dehydrogenase family protein [Ramlibacter agri]
MGLADWSAVARRCEIVVFDRPLASEDEAVAALADVDIVCTLRERMPFPRSLIARLPKLKYIAVTGMRYDTVDTAAAAERGIPVSNSEVSRGGGGVSELAWGLVLAAARHIAHEDAVMRRGGWQTRVGFTLRGKTLGILGLGRIGSRMAAYAQAFEMKVLAWSPHLTPERASASGAGCAGLDELLRGSDVVTVHLPLAEGTRGLIGARELALMKPEALLVNTSRAAIVDQQALLDALRERRIGGAGLDVYEAEPLPADHPLRGLDNTVLTPHIGYFTRDMLRVYYEDAVEAILAFLDGAPVRVVNAEALARR